MAWTAYLFPVQHNRKTVSAGATETVYELRIPSGCYGFIQSVANNYFQDTNESSKDTRWYWYVDHRLVEPEPIRRQLGLPNRPLDFNPPILVKDRIKVDVYNTLSESANMEFMCRGVIYNWVD